ncbi:MAG TPA: cytochrome b/b6 domain-containing protein [Bryobacteraceae bacterium]|nr:cytochrome b/b6 domain-containing protein [Bryobacteraceae bacterium]
MSYNPPMTAALGARHSALVRVTHWITALAFVALLVTGGEILLSHPRFYWGETGNVLTRPLFQLPLPSSRDMVVTGYGYVLPDQNGWSRYLHFEAAWVAVLTGLVYVISGLMGGHFRRNLLPGRGYPFWTVEDAQSYSVLQRTAYLLVVFVLFPLVVWTGLAMSPAMASVFPAAVAVLGGQQSARTIHFFVSILLAIFLLIHVAMVWIAGFRARVGAMITGRAGAGMERV